MTANPFEAAAKDTTLCSVGKARARMKAEDQKHLDQALSQPETMISSRSIWRTLRDHYDEMVSKDVVAEHRRGLCVCVRKKGNNVG